MNLGTGYRGEILISQGRSISDLDESLGPGPEVRVWQEVIRQGEKVPTGGAVKIDYFLRGFLAVRKGGVCVQVAFVEPTCCLECVIQNTSPDDIASCHRLARCVQASSSDRLDSQILPFG